MIRYDVKILVGLDRFDADDVQKKLAALGTEGWSIRSIDWGRGPLGTGGSRVYGAVLQKEFTGTPAGNLVDEREIDFMGSGRG